MLIKRLSLLTLLLFFTCMVMGQKKRVRIFASEKIYSSTITTSFGSYEIRSDNKKIGICTFDGKESIVVSPVIQGVRIAINGASIGTFKHITFSSANEGCVLKICTNTSPAGRNYEQDLDVYSDTNTVLLVSNIAIEKYVCSVLSGEIGYNAQPEFLKAKAIICRTFALSQTSRHNDKRYDFCCETHCQVYKGRKEVTYQIIRAVKATEGKVIRDAQGIPIIAAFHSNCGGRTQNSEDAWSSSLPYLRSVIDSFCWDQPHGRWESKIPLTQWKTYLQKTIATTNQTPPGHGESLDLIDPTRQKFYEYRGQQIPMRQIRNDLNLKSAWFTITELQDTILLRGRGYGHGVGLCQEGAMKLADMDCSCDQIIRFYYKNVHISK